MATAKTVVLIQGETTPLSLALTDNKGAPINLTGATVTLSLINTQDWMGEDFDPPRSQFSGGNTRLTTPQVQDVPLTISDATAGTLTWVPSATATEIPGKYIPEIKVVFFDGSISKGPKDRSSLILRILPKIGA